MANVAEGNLKASISLATTTKWGRDTFPKITHFTIDPYLKLLSVKEEGITYLFRIFGRLDLGFSTGLLCHCRTHYQIDKRNI